MRILKIDDQGLVHEIERLRSKIQEIGLKRPHIVALTRENVASIFATKTHPTETGTGWLGRQDSNLGMAESKSAALPLGYAPSGRSLAPRRADHSGGIRTNQRP
jgi:hypothetical protein